MDMTVVQRQSNREGKKAEIASFTGWQSFAKPASNRNGRLERTKQARDHIVVLGLLSMETQSDGRRLLSISGRLRL